MKSKVNRCTRCNWYKLGVLYSSAFEKYLCKDCIKDLSIMLKATKKFEQVDDDCDKYKVFHDHIKAHFEKEHPDWKVICKICGKTVDEIYNEYTKVKC